MRTKKTCYMRMQMEDLGLIDRHIRPQDIKELSYQGRECQNTI